MALTSKRTAELAWERSQLDHTAREIVLGRHRLQKQHVLVAALRGRGRDTAQAERLARLLDQSLVQWECHQGLIRQRIDYLEYLNRSSLIQR